MSSHTVAVGILLFDEVEVLDFAGPFEVFSTASRVSGDDGSEEKPHFEVFTVAEMGGHVVARGGLQVVASYGLDSHPKIDLLIVPGGIVNRELEKGSVVDWISRVAATAQITASVCTGAFLLAAAGLLGGREATTHWEDIEEFELTFPQVKVRKKVRWVDEGTVVTSAGISAGIDMSLHLIGRVAGVDIAGKTARQMEYVWIAPKG